MTLKMIYAADPNGAIGYNGRLPWPRIGAHMQRFRNVTMGGYCIVGRKTFELLPAPLDGRVQVVISSHYDVLDKIKQPNEHKDTVYMPDVKSAIKTFPDAFIVGGRQVFLGALPFVDEVWFTYVNQECLAAAVFFHRAGIDVFEPPLWDCWGEPSNDVHCRFFRFKRVKIENNLNVLKLSREKLQRLYA